MKWMLIVIVYGTMPVETGFLFDNIDACYQAEDKMRAEQARAINEWLTWARQNPKEANYPDSTEFMTKRLSSGVCVPYAS